MLQKRHILKITTCSYTILVTKQNKNTFYKTKNNSYKTRQEKSEIFLRKYIILIKNKSTSLKSEIVLTI